QSLSLARMPKPLAWPPRQAAHEPSSAERAGLPEVHESRAHSFIEAWDIKFHINLARDLGQFRVDAATEAVTPIVGDNDGVPDACHAFRSGDGILQIADVIHETQFFRFHTGIDPAVRQLADLIHAHVPAAGHNLNKLAVELIDRALQNRSFL